MRFFKDWFKSLLLEYVIIEVKPTPVNFDHAAISRSLAVDIAPAIASAADAAAQSALKLHSDAVRQVICHAIEAIPAPVVNIPQPVAVVDSDVVATQLGSRIEAIARKMIAEALQPPPPVTKGEQPIPDVPPEPSLEASLLERLPTDIQYAVRYSCRKVQMDNPSPSQGTTLGNNWHRNEACEWAKTFLRERGLKAHDTDINLACELYYRVYIRPGKVKQ